MNNNNPMRFLSHFLLLGASLICANPVYAARAIDLGQQPISLLRSFAATPAAQVNSVKMQEVSRSVDFNQTLHVRVQETYRGYPVRGGDAVVHIPGGAKTAKSFTAIAAAATEKKGNMNGTLYQDLQADLNNTPAYLFHQDQAKKALNHVVHAYPQKADIRHEKSELIIYMDKNKKAHWAYQVSFYAMPVKTGDMPAKPLYIVDALSFEIYKQWNDLKTIDAGGFGGNKKMGKLTYDGLAANLPKLNMQRDEVNQVCSLQNNDVTVKNYLGQIMRFDCRAKDAEHDQVYWNGAFDAVNDGYSPANDALYAGTVIKDMYQKWYSIPVLVNPDGTAMMLTMLVHLPQMDNAYWDDVNMQMLFGDGDRFFYPLTSLGVAAHEISHGFTNQHSDLIYNEQSGGMNEAFSDMASQAAEFYAYGKNTWQLGAEIYKLDDMEALRFMDQPGKDCQSRENLKPGFECSLDHASQYEQDKNMNVHFTSGIYNRAFYLLSTTPGWDTRKAFDVMVQANRHYWTSDSTFAQGACGVLKATRDYNLNEEDVVQAFKKVGIEAKC